MFTGIVQEIGIFRKIEKTGRSCRLEIRSSAISKSVKTGDSVSVNGVCLTVVAKSKDTLTFDVMAETLRSTNLADFRIGDKVNLEGALKAGGSLDGHFVLGHIDCAGTIRDIIKSGGEFVITIAFPSDFNRLIVDKGSIAVDGVSLTVNNPGNGTFDLHLIPHTLKTTVLNVKKAGDKVNLEFDILGKYIERRGAPDGASRITEEYLRSKGF